MVAASPGTTTPAGGISLVAVAVDQVKRPGFAVRGVAGGAGWVIGFSANIVIRPRAISSSWLCMVGASSSRTCIKP